MGDARPAPGETGTLPEQLVASCPERLRRAEAVIERRTSRFCVVLERVLDSHNQMAVMRTAEALGVQRVWVVQPKLERRPRGKRKHESDAIDTELSCGKRIIKKCDKWLSVRIFSTPAECVAALRAENWAIWATAMGPEAFALDSSAESRAQLCPLPSRLALVVGREGDGLSPEMLAAADKKVFVPMFGWTESLNLSVATAMVLQRLFDWCPEARGDLTSEERKQLREQWHELLANNPTAEAKHREWQQQAATAVGCTAAEVPIPALPDLRRDNAESWIPKSIREMESEALGQRDKSAS